MTFLQSSWGLGSGYGFGLAIAIARATAGMLKVGNILLQRKCCRWQIHEMSFQRFFATAMCKTKKIPKKQKNTKKQKKPVGGGRILVFFVFFVFLFFFGIFVFLGIFGIFCFFIFFLYFCFFGIFAFFCYFWLFICLFIYLLSSLYICLYNTVLYHVLCKMYWNMSFFM